AKARGFQTSLWVSLRKAAGYGGGPRMAWDMPVSAVVCPELSRTALRARDDGNRMFPGRVCATKRTCGIRSRGVGRGRHTRIVTARKQGQPCCRCGDLTAKPGRCRLQAKMARGSPAGVRRGVK